MDFRQSFVFKIDQKLAKKYMRCTRRVPKGYASGTPKWTLSEHEWHQYRSFRAVAGAR